MSLARFDTSNELIQKRSSITSPVSQTCMLSLFQCITRCSLISLEEIKLTGIANPYHAKCSKSINFLIFCLSK